MYGHVGHNIRSNTPLIWWAWLPHHSITTMSTVRSLALRKVKLKMKSLLSSVFSWQCSLLPYQPTYVHMHMALVPSQNDSNTKRVSLLCKWGTWGGLNSKLYYMWPILTILWTILTGAPTIGQIVDSKRFVDWQFYNKSFGGSSPGRFSKINENLTCSGSA